MNLLHRPRAWAILAAAMSALASAPAVAAFAYQLVDLGYFSADSGPISIANAINNQRRVVGWADHDLGNAPFRYDYGVSTSIAPLGVPGEFGVANAVDAAGRIVGSSFTGGAQRTFLYDAGTVTDPLAASAPAGSEAIARGIAGDRIVGNYFVGSAPERAFMQVIGGAFKDLGVLAGGSSAVAAAVNASGVAVGYGDVGTGVGRGILFGAASPQELPRLFGSTRATDINDAGVIVGFSEDADGYRRPVRFDVAGNQAIDLGVLPGFLSGEANAVNAAGVAVGSTAGFFGEVRATLFADGTVTDLNTLADLTGWMRLTVANDINDFGDIVGEGLNEAGDTRAFLLLKLDSPPAPVPEPGTWGLLVLGLGTMLVLGRRHRVGRRLSGDTAAA